MQGESVQIMWMFEQPGAGNSCFVHCSFAGPQKEYRPHHSTCPSKMASWIRHLGIDCCGGISVILHSSASSAISDANADSL
jgi:hypothetical protein